MSEFLKSAMGYFNPGPNSGCNNDFVGQMVEVGAVTLRVKRVIAEGLFNNFSAQIGLVFFVCIACFPQRKKQNYPT